VSSGSLATSYILGALHCILRQLPIAIMKCVIPEISYHNRDPVLSVDFQAPQPGQPTRLATAGSDTHVVIWGVKKEEEGEKVELHCLCDLTRHQRAVNIVRWSPDGQLLASGDDESIIIIWKMKEGKGSGGNLFDDGADNNTENWTVYQMIRSHLDDIYDLAWSPCSNYLLSGSVDNTAIVTQVHKNKKVSLLSDSRGFVQGVAWNPKHNMLSTVGSDRSCRTYNSKVMKLMSKTYKCTLNMEGHGKSKSAGKKKKVVEKENKTKEEETEKKQEDEVLKLKSPKDSSVKEVEDEKEGAEKKKKREDQSVRLFHDDTFKGFFRRLCWSNDGELLVVPSGVVETDEEKNFTHCSWVFTRLNLAKPVLCLPTKDKYTIAVKFHPKRFSLRQPSKKLPSSKPEDPEWVKAGSLFALPYRLIYAVATQNAIMFYDTQQATPFGRVSNIHYTGLTDLAWSPCGNILVVSSSDGFCSVVTFEPGELGEEMKPSSSVPSPSILPSSLPSSSTPSASTSPNPKHLPAENDKTDSSPSKPQPKSCPTNDDSPCKPLLTSPAAVPLSDSPSPVAPGGSKMGPKRLQFITLSSPKASKKKQTTDEKDAGSPCGLLFEDAMQEAAVESAAEELGVELMDTEAAHLSLVLEESQSEMEPVLLAAKVSKPELKEDLKPEAKKRVPLTTIANPLPSKIKAITPEKKTGRRVNLITISSPKGKT